MFKKLSYVISFMLILSLTGNAFAGDWWTWDGGGTDTRWGNPDNWDGGVVPTGSDAIWIGGGYTATVETDSVTTTAGTHIPGATWIGFAEGADVTIKNGGYLWEAGSGIYFYESTVTVDAGGILQGYGTMNVAYDTGNNCTLNLNGLSYSTLMRIAHGIGSTAVVNYNCTDGISTHNSVHVGTTGSGTLNMIAGTLNASADFGIATGLVNLTGGQITTADLWFWLDDGLMTISGGRMIIDGDELVEVQGYISSGLITSPGTLYIDYDETNAGKTTLYAIEHNFAPVPADGGQTPASTTAITWDLPDPNGVGAVTCDVVFGTDPNFIDGALLVNPLNALTTDTGTSLAVSLVADEDYYWQLTVHDPELDDLLSPVFSFDTRNVPPVADAGADIDSWMPDAGGDRVLVLDGTGSSDGGDGPTLTYLWEVTENANDLNPAILVDETTATPTLTIPENGTYTLSLIVDDGVETSAADILTVTVYSDSCAHAQGIGDEMPAGDIDNDCDVDMDDLAAMSSGWLMDLSSIE